ncbi:MAG: hypothetical protein ACE5GX_09095 [Thermoanaerobaculia bacterium]
MIEFVTLLLGIAAGPQTVELSASNEVAEIRLFLDRRQVASDSEAPWRVDFDLGEELRPHRLEAVAYDAEGAELARTSQRLNVPRPPAEARVVLERDPAGTVKAALISWESSVARYPFRTRAWFDGTSLPVTNPKRIPIPRHDKSMFHFLQVELEFSKDVMAQAQAVFGGLYLDQARADLTAFPVHARGKARNLRSSQMAGWLSLKDGGDLAVSALDRGRLDLVLVRGPGVGAAMQTLEGTISQGVTSGGTGTPGVSDMSAAAQIANIGVATASERMRRIMAFEEGQRLRILAPNARAQTGSGVAMTAFALSPEITPNQGGMYWALRQDVDLPGLSPDLRLADAVAVAGLQAANGNRRRGVLLVLADPAGDRSRHQVRGVREFLDSIRVPLFVWRIGEPVSDAWKEWGEGESITNFRQLQGAARRLNETLGRQRIVWLEGLHLPNEIEIGPAAKLEPVTSNR